MIAPPTWVDRYFQSAFILNDDGVGELTLKETATTGDPRVTIKGLYGSTTTPDATTVFVDLPWQVLDGELWAVSVYVSAKGTGIRRRITVEALVYGDDTTATLDDDPAVDTKGTGTATATLVVNGAAGMRLSLAPVAATALVWGFEVRAQRL